TARAGGDVELVVDAQPVAAPIRRAENQEAVEEADLGVQLGSGRSRVPARGDGAASELPEARQVHILPWVEEDADQHASANGGAEAAQEGLVGEREDLGRDGPSSPCQGSLQKRPDL